MSEVTSPLLQGIRDTLLRPQLSDTSEAIANIVDENAECSSSATLTTMQMCYCVKQDANKFLDSARAAFNSLTEDLQAQVSASSTALCNTRCELGSTATIAGLGDYCCSSCCIGSFCSCLQPEQLPWTNCLGS